MDLSSVPFFKRPMQSSNKDQWVGQDEAGNNVYKMSNGQTYTVKPDADQRTTRTKVEEDVIPAVKEYAEDPSLPSTEDMKQFGMDVATGAYESLKGAVEGTGTMGDVFGVVPAMAAGSAAFDVPEDALRLFGGQRARQANREDLKEFVKRYRGKTPEEQKQLWEEFGWGKNARGDVRFEIDDSSFGYKGVPEPRTFYELGSVIEHEELFNNYPELKSILISEQTAYDPQEIMGEMRLLSDNTPYINIAADMTPEEKRLTILHELQHVIQTVEDPDFQAKYNRESNYQRNPAEIEAFAVEPRADMTKEQRRKTMPSFAEGGSVESQMQELRVDPVSGNEVPPGSLPEEVRDDVNAKLSEGEYVVPADVVRYFGVGYFEKLRKKAKEAMEEMDEDGRIGGDPVEEDDEDDDDLPFSTEELATMDDEEPVRMAEGGFVGGLADGVQMGADASAAYMEQQKQNAPAAKAGGNEAASGLRVYVNDAGQQRTIMFVDGQPIQEIPKGFRPMTDGDSAEKDKPEGGMGTDGTDGGFGNDTGPAAEGAGLGGLGGIAGAIGGIAGAVGDAIGGAFGGFGGGGGSGGAGGGSGPDGAAGDSGSNGGMGGVAARGMLVDKRVKQKPVAKPGKRSLVQRKR